MPWPTPTDTPRLPEISPQQDSAHPWADLEHLARSPLEHHVARAVIEHAQRLGGPPEDPRPRLSSMTQVGQLILGPLLGVFTVWLAQQMMLRQPHLVLFAARDGLLLRQLYESLRHLPGGHNLPASRYLRISRSLISKASLRSDQDLAALCHSPFAGTVDDLLAERLPAGLAGVSTSSPDAPRTALDAAGAQLALQRAFAHRDQILQDAAGLRQHYSAYLHRLGVREGGTFAFFDLVSMGTCQAGLEQLVTADWQGFYLGFYRGMPDWHGQVSALLTRGVHPGEHPSWLLGRYHLLETMVTSTEASVSTMNCAGAFLSFAEHRCSAHLACLEQLHAAVRDTWASMVAELSSLISPAALAGGAKAVYPEFADRLWRHISSTYSRLELSFLDGLHLRDDLGRGMIALRVPT